MRRTILVAALTLAAPAVGIAAAGDQHHSQVARTPGLTATFSYVESGGELPHRYTDGRVTIVRADGRRFAFSLRPLRPGYDVAPIFAGPDGKAIHIRHLDDKRGDPEVVVDLYWGGAHCCFYTVVFRYDPAARTYVRASHLWGDTSPRVRELGSDGRLEFVSGDDRFAYAFTSFADSAFPIQIWKFAAGRFVDATRSFPAQIRASAKRHLAEYRSRRHSDRSVRGILAAYLAERSLLGESRQGWTVVRQAAARGELAHTYDGPDSAATYLVRLKAFLARNGYGR
jgi:hypothetical protein